MKNIVFIFLIAFIASCTNNTYNIVDPPVSKPVLTTNPINNISNTMAFSGGTFITGGEATITSKGVCWSTNHNPTINDYKSNDGTDITNYSSAITGLTKNTTYYVRAYAINSAGVGYGNELSFTTKDSTATIDSSIYLPTVIINNVYSITETSATASGNITNQGGSSITERGFQFSKVANLTSGTGIMVGFGSGGFYKAISSLSPNTTYYIRAYAINSYGIAYSNIISFKTLSTPTTVTDIDGNVYHTVTIGSQVWMVENLRTTRYNDGTSISTSLADATWYASNIGAYAIYNNDMNNNNTYGKLYNWYSVNTGKLAPVGWHIPTYTEWTTLVNYLGGVNVAGEKMKLISNLWAPYSGITNTNSSGFSGLPGGMRTGNGPYYYIGDFGKFWSSTEYISYSAWALTLTYAGNSASLSESTKVNGCSIRCIKD
ncbi:MAG TPA: fibrobacter succinogenes major paralogous domain-containing protein [Chitinophagales bacterium]|jgi:uncharacterized protein (TIGR02145 family)|nr:fibrobacter succinogenes major paralogous domain-containing protein [Chitinophagales bacterium]